MLDIDILRYEPATADPAPRRWLMGTGEEIEFGIPEGLESLNAYVFSPSSLGRFVNVWPGGKVGLARYPRGGVEYAQATRFELKRTELAFRKDGWVSLQEPDGTAIYWSDLAEGQKSERFLEEVFVSGGYLAVVLLASGPIHHLDVAHLINQLGLSTQPRTLAGYYPRQQVIQFLQSNNLGLMFRVSDMYDRNRVLLYLPWKLEA